MKSIAVGGRRISLLLCTMPAAMSMGSPDPEQVKDAIWRAAEWQMANPERFLPLGWEIAPLYDGLLNAAKATGEPAYLGEVIGFGEPPAWSPGPRFYHADDHAVGHAWLDCFLIDGLDADRLDPIRSRFDAILANPENRPVEYCAFDPASNRWTWCDALYMAPPTWARLHTATADPAYLDFLDQEWQYSHQMLWNPDHALYRRDSCWLDATAANGQPVFWARGNGWVFAGLAILLPHLPDDHPTRPFYIDQFQLMAQALLDAQQPSGLWAPNLLDPNDPPSPESSGTAFFTFGLAWGVNNGLLDPALAWPAVELAWDGLSALQQPDGKVGWVQPPAAGPASAGPDDHHTYGTGAFLLAGSEILKRIEPGNSTSLGSIHDEAIRYARAYRGIREIRPLEGVTVLDWSGDDGNVPENAFDGIVNGWESRWSVFGLGDPKFVEVDLGGTREIAGIVLHTLENRDYQYLVEARMPGESYQVIVDRTANTEPGPIIDAVAGAPFTARELKVTVTGAHTYPGPWVSLTEVEILLEGDCVGRPLPPPGVRPLRPYPGDLPADLDGNGWVDQSDTLTLIHAVSIGDASGDFNGDTQANFFDLLDLLAELDGACD